MNYQETLVYLAQNCHGGAPAGLERMLLMAELSGHPEQQVPLVHVAGTNGKGSTTAMMASVLTAAGKRTGAYTSPHLVSYTERISIDNKPIAENDFTCIMGWLQENMIPELLARGMAHPSEFEMLTMTALIYFANEQADIAIIEVGLGGRLDSTNIIQPVLAVITPVSMDHAQILGDTIAAIAAEKAGIIKPDLPVIAADQREEALAEIRAQSQRMNSPLLIVSKNCCQRLDHQLSTQQFSCRTPEYFYRRLSINLLGNYQLINAGTAIHALEALQRLGLVNFNEAVLAQGLAQAQWPGRMEYLSIAGGYDILLDGAHNEDGIMALAEALQGDFAERSLILLLGILDDKDQKKMLQTLLPLAKQVIITKPAEKRAENWSHLAILSQQICPGLPVTIIDRVEDALVYALAQARHGELLCVTGSLYLLGSCRKWLFDQFN